MSPPSRPTRSGWSAPAGSRGSTRSPATTVGEPAPEAASLRAGAPGKRLRNGAEVGLMADGDPVQVAANGRDVGAAADRQHLLQQLGGQAAGDQRRPAGL